MHANWIGPLRQRFAMHGYMLSKPYAELGKAKPAGSHSEALAALRRWRPGARHLASSSRRREGVGRVVLVIFGRFLLKKHLRCWLCGDAACFVSCGHETCSSSTKWFLPLAVIPDLPRFLPVLDLHTLWRSRTTSATCRMTTRY